MWTGTWWVLNFTHLYCFPWISSTYTWHLCPWLSLSLKSVNDHLFYFKALRGKCHSHQRRTKKHQPYRNSETKLAQLYDTSELWAHFILNIFKGKHLLSDAETRKRVVLHWRAKSDADEAFKVSQRWGMGGRQIMWSDTIHTCVCDIYLFISQIEPSANTRDEIRQFLDLIHENYNLFQISDTLLADLLFGIFSADCGSVRLLFLSRSPLMSSCTCTTVMLLDLLQRFQTQILQPWVCFWNPEKCKKALTAWPCSQDRLEVCGEVTECSV